MRSPQAIPIGEPDLPITPGVPSVISLPIDAPGAEMPISPYRIEFRPRDGLAEDAQTLVSCENAETCRAHVEPSARRLLDQRRSGEVHLVESATGRSLAQRPVWRSGEAPRPEWVAWSTHTLLPKL